MKRRGALACALVAAALYFACTAQTTHAQPAGQTQARGDDLQRYDELIDKGVREHRLGHFAEAKAFFERAHAIQPSARTLRGLAMAAYELRHYVEAIGYIDAALASEVKPLTPEMRGELEGLLREARLFVARVQVRLSPDTASLQVDARPVELTSDGTLLLDVGRHEFVASAGGYEPVARTVQAEAGEELLVELTLVQEGAAGEQVDALVSEGEERGGSLTPWLVVGGGAAAAVAGGVLTALALQDVGDVEDAPVGTSWGDVKDANDRSPLLSGLGIGLLAAGATAVVVGIVLWQTDDSGETAEPRTRLQLTPAGAQVTGHF